MIVRVFLLVLIAVLFLALLDFDSDSNFVKMRILSPKNATVADIQNFSFSINNDVCGYDPVNFVIIVSSAPGNSTARNVLRQVFYDFYH